MLNLVDVKQRIRQLQALSHQDLGVLLIATLLLPLAGLSMYLFGFKYTQKLFTITKPDLLPEEQQKLQKAQAIARMVAISANHGLYRANCLQKSLVLYLLLRMSGIEADLCIGVQKVGVYFNAHAWVELNDAIIMDRSDIKLFYSKIYNS